MTVTQILLAMMLMKTKPQDLPFSIPLLYRLVILNIISGIFSASMYMELAEGVGVVVKDVLILIAFTYYVLNFSGKAARLVQTLSALAGTGILFNLLVWPLLMQMPDSNLDQVMNAWLALAILMLSSWSVLVTAHIYKHSLESSMFNAVILSFMLLLISIVMSQMLFPAH